MKWKPLFFKMPLSIILLTLLANLYGFISSGFFQSIYIITSGEFGSEPISNSIMYSIGAGILISYGAIPVSLALMIIVTLIFPLLNKWHVVFAGIVGLFIGISALGSIYWGVPMFAYTLTTAVSSCLLIMRRQKHLTRRLSRTP